MHQFSDVSAVLNKTVLRKMDTLHNGLGSKLRDRLQNFRRYVVDFSAPDDNFESIMDGICSRQ